IDGNDAFIFVFGPEDKTKKSLDVITNRLKMALDGVPTETRKALDDLDTEFIRELHGDKRLYPDTDMHPIFITDKTIDELRSEIPEYPWEIIDRIYDTYNIDKNFIVDLILNKKLSLFEKVMSQFDVDPKLVCVTLLETLKALGRKDILVENITDEKIVSIFKALDNKKIAKEALDNILPLMAKKPEMKLDEILKDLDIKKISKDSVYTMIDEIIEKNKDFIVENGKRSFNALMGDVMKEIRGKMDGKTVSKILRDKINKFLEKVK
ncbi:MAG: hypothetical protein EU549_02690, partial [Promethearchaeota archaeon]